MRIICVGQVENDNITSQIAKQTVLPDEVMLYFDPLPERGVELRRQRIADNHRRLQQFVRDSDADLVFQVEGDSILPENALERLLNGLKELDSDDFGYISGIQIGRHGVYMIGAWHFTDEGFHSQDYKATGIQEVDSTGFYCLLAKREAWLQGECTWNGERWGPDSNFGLSLKKKGYKIYVDMDLPIGHKTGRGILYPDHISTCNVRFYREDGHWKYRTT